jgi:1-acyl-sn-glycerol-3-phosphate acyltransferase
MIKKFTLVPRILISLWIYFFVIFTIVLLFPIALLLRLLSYPFNKNLPLIRILYCFFSRLYIIFSPFWKIRVNGKNKFQRNKVYVVIANHQSMLDIIVIHHLYREYSWVSKAENFSYPFLGWLMRISGDIKLERDNPQSFARLVRNCNRKLVSGCSIIIFPEGTRTPDGEIQRFKEGAFRIAQLSKIGILPVVLDGTREVLPKKGILMKPSSRFIISVMDEIPYESFKDENPRLLADRLRGLMSDELLKIRQEN